MLLCSIYIASHECIAHLESSEHSIHDLLIQKPSNTEPAYIEKQELNTATLKPGNFQLSLPLRNTAVYYTKTPEASML